MKKIFLDTDVIIDFITDRVPYSFDILKIFQMAVKGEVVLQISSLSISNVHYILSKIEGQKNALEKIKKLIQLVDILAVDRGVVFEAVNSQFKDFEDALQNFCAQKAQINTIITRNIKDYKVSNLAILTPSEFIAKTLNES